jgi:endonuclease/exonuclease/phosphatase family metal-dependent hydrolase
MPTPLSEPSGNELSLITYNVHALPSLIAGDNPPARLPLIGQRLHQYDVALVQEIWLYRDRLTNYSGDSTVIPGKGPRGGFDRIAHPFGTGILFLSQYSRHHILDEESENFGVCEGRWRRANDCWARKGYLRVRLLIGKAPLDIYTFHLDAGESSSDRRAREKQLAILRDRITAGSGDGPVIIAGDFNLAYETPADRALLDRFATQLGLKESGARASTRWKENIDYVLYRSSPSVRVELLDAREDTTFVDNGKALSDHPAIAVHFRIDSDS